MRRLLLLLILFPSLLFAGTNDQLPDARLTDWIPTQQIWGGGEATRGAIQVSMILDLIQADDVTGLQTYITNTLGIELNATADQTAIEIRDLLDTLFGGPEWRTQDGYEPDTVLTDVQIIAALDAYFGSTAWRTQAANELTADELAAIQAANSPSAANPVATQNDIAAAGGGDVTGITAGAGLAGGGSSGEISLYIPNQGGFAAGVFTNPNITVDQRGVITAIENGTGGGTTDHSALSNLDYASSGHTGFATAAQGAAADSAIQPGDNISGLINDSGYLVSESDPTFAASEAANFATGDKSKLDGIAPGAEVNVNPDWNAASGDSQILNKPTIPTAVSQLTNDSGYLTTESDPGVATHESTYDHADIATALQPEDRGSDAGDLPYYFLCGSCSIGTETNDQDCVNAGGIWTADGSGSLCLPSSSTALAFLDNDTCSPALLNRIYWDNVDLRYEKCDLDSGTPTNIDIGGDDLGTSTYSDVVALWTTCTGYLKSDGTCDDGGSVVENTAYAADWENSLAATSKGTLFTKFELLDAAKLDIFDDVNPFVAGSQAGFYVKTIGLDLISDFLIGGAAFGAVNVPLADAAGNYTSTTVEAAFAEVQQKINAVTNEIVVMDGKLDFGAVGDTIVHPGFSISADDCSITATDQTLTCTSAIFKDTGRTIIVYGAGTGGTNLETSIASINSGISVELTDAAVTTVSDALVRYGENGCSMVSGSPTITCTYPVFTDTATDSGKLIAVEAAGAAGAVLVSTVSSVTNTYSADLAANAGTTARYSWMKFGTDDSTAVKTANEWASDNKSKVHWPAGIYMYDDESVIQNTSLIDGDGSYITLFTPIPGYAGGWFMTLDDAWGQATPNPLDGADGGMGVNSQAIAPIDYKQGPVLQGFSVIGQRQLDPVGTHGIRSYNRVDRTIWTDVSFFYLNGTAVSLGLQGGTAYGDAGQMGCLRESQFFRNVIRGSGVAGTYKAFEIGTQTPDAGGAAWSDATNINTFYTTQLIYNYGESGIYDDSGKALNTRQMVFYDLKQHGFADYAFWQSESVDPDLFVLEGDIQDINFTDYHPNGGTPNGAMMRLKEDAINNDYPKNIKIDGYSIQYDDSIVIEEAANVRVTGVFDSGTSTATGAAVRVLPNALKAGRIVLDVEELNDPVYQIDYSSNGNIYWMNGGASYDKYPNLITNYGSFETDLDSWTYASATYGDTPAVTGRTNAEAVIGSYSVAINGSDDNASSCQERSLYRIFDTSAGGYVLRFWAKGDQAGTTIDVLEQAGVGTAHLGIAIPTHWRQVVIPLDDDVASNQINIRDNYCDDLGASQYTVFLDQMEIARALTSGEAKTYNPATGRFEPTQAGTSATNIAEGDSSVTVDDTGTGTITIQADSGGSPTGKIVISALSGGTAHTKITSGSNSGRLTLTASALSDAFPRLQMLPDNDAAATVRGWLNFDYGSQNGAPTNPAHMKIRYTENGSTFLDMFDAVSNDYVQIYAADGDPTTGTALTNNHFTVYMDETANTLKIMWRESDGSSHTSTLPAD